MCLEFFFKPLHPWVQLAPHILADGRIVETGGRDLAATLEQDGYAAFAPETDDDATDASASALSGLF